MIRARSRQRGAETPAHWTPKSESGLVLDLDAARAVGVSGVVPTLTDAASGTVWQQSVGSQKPGLFTGGTGGQPYLNFGLKGNRNI